MREPKPEFAALTGGPAPGAPLWRVAPSQRVRDLAWCTLSPGLLSSLQPAVGMADTHGAALARWPVAAAAAWERWLRAADPGDLPPTIEELAAAYAGGEPSNGRSLRLGRHAESLLHFALERVSGLRLVAFNLPVRRAGGHGVQTLGELDFVWRDLASGQIVHWEMAAKFYLLVPPDEGRGDGAGNGKGNGPDAGEAVASPWLRNFVGPNLVDRLSDKLQHIVQRQLPLSHTPEAQAVLGAPVDRSEVYLLGWLFYPDGIEPPEAAAHGLAPDHLRGWWSTLEGWTARVAATSAGAHGRSDTRWHRLPRARWMSPAVVAEADTESFDAVRAALAERFADSHHERGWRRETPVMVCEVEPAADAPGLWRERSRGFVVPPGWPQRASQRVAQDAPR